MDKLVIAKFKLLTDNAKLPEYKTSGAAGFDLYSVENVTLKSGEIKVIATGLAVEIPTNYELQIRSRSGLASQGVSVLNSPGTIDSDYRGEIKIILCNHTQSDFKVQAGDRIAQGVIAHVPPVLLAKVEVLTETDRNDKGFGSTGKN